MERLTEYHCGVAVIKDKSKLGEAMAKLALYEDAEEQKKVNNGILIHAGADGVFESFEPFAMITCQTIKDYTRLNDALAKVNEKPRSNGDKIRAMTDEELTEIIQCPYDTAGKQEDIMPCILDEDEPDFVPCEDCQKCMLNWLGKEITSSKDVEIQCKCSTGYGKCIVDMDAQQTLGGTIVCDTAEECNFDKSLILKRCEHALMKEVAADDK